MFHTFLNAMLDCHHRRTTFPVTPGRTPAAALRQTYVVCLDCGAELPYDWAQMRLLPCRVQSAGSTQPESSRSVAALSVPVKLEDDASAQPQVCQARPAAVASAGMSPAGNHDGPVACGITNHDKATGQAAIRQPAPVTTLPACSYLVRARLRTQQVQVALRVLNALMTGLSAAPDDVAKLRSWTGPGDQACSTRDLAQRVVTCAVSP